MGLFDFIGGRAAAKAQKKGAEESLAYLAAERKKAQQRGEELYGEYTPAGSLGMDALKKQYDILVKGDISQFQQSPGYQFALEQGTQALERGAAARGGLYGGAQMKALTGYGQGLASQDFGNYLTQLGNLSIQGTNIGMGGARGIMSQYGGVDASQVGQAMQNVGAAKAALKAMPWQAGQGLFDTFGQILGQKQQESQQSIVGPYGPQQPRSSGFGFGDFLGLLSGVGGGLA